MLTIEDVCKLYSEGVDIKMHSKTSKEDTLLKGLWDPSLNEVNIYLPVIESKEDFYITLLHEFIHAKREYYSGNPGKEKEVEALAQRTYKKSPEISTFIVDFYKLKVPKQFR